MLDRFALSKLALKTKLRFNSLHTSRIVDPISSFICGRSSTHGPAITSSGWPAPTLIVPMVQVLDIAKDYLRRWRSCAAWTDSQPSSAVKTTRTGTA